ncbi:permease [Granulicella sp. WH15]|uniref:permease n=1 Tax=Granulicella sp. WH15 TaxID=2602070 RepID=UPI001367015E|nr:permease [Granulicella sp. WH15]QHN03833.1 permease [Granulicella sp. WH15]
MFRTVFHLRERSLLRGTVLVLVSLAVSFVLSDFPRNRPNLFLILPVLFSVMGTFDTVRCMQRRWNFYHAGVILLIYMDLMVICLILFLLLYPYALWLSQTH